MSQETTITEEAAAESTPGDEEGTKSAEEVREDDSTRIVIANGQDLDKSYRHGVSKRMARDWDLRKLAYLGPLLWAFITSMVIGLVVYGIIQAGGTIIDTINAIVTIPVAFEIGAIVQTISENLSSILVIIVLLLFFAGLLFDHASYLYSSFEKLSTKFIGLLISFFTALNLGVWQKSNYWNPFTSNLSDRDPLIALTNGTDASVSGIFADGPHYQNVFVDSVYIKVGGDLGFRRGLLTALYDYRWRWVRRLPLGILIGVLVLSEVGVLPYTGVYQQVIALVVVAILAVLALTRYPQFIIRFLGETAGLSRYKRLLNETDPGETRPTRDDGRTGLSNSMSGYGLLFVSEFLYWGFGYVNYEISVDDSLLSDENGDSENDSETESENDDAPNPLRGYEEIRDEHALAAARELLWCAVPRESVCENGSNADISITITGVDYYAKDERAYRLRTRIAHWIADDLYDEDNSSAEGNVADSNESSTNRSFKRKIAESVSNNRNRIADLVSETQNQDDTTDIYEADEDSQDPFETEEILTRKHAGNKINIWSLLKLIVTDQKFPLSDFLIGFRLPVKKFVSIPDNFPVEEIKTRPGKEPDIYRFTDPDEGDLYWDEETIHYVLLGGGEHQQGIAKHVLSMKAAGYENVDLLENAFLSVRKNSDSDSSENILSRISEKTRRSIHRFANRKPPGPPVDIDGVGDNEVDDDKALFPTEYFVSGVFGEEEFFRQSDHSFVMFSHEPEIETASKIEQNIIVHTIIGMSAVGTKVGFLYWLYQLETESQKLNPQTDTMHCFNHGRADAIENLRDIGHLYLNVDWRERDWEDAIDFGEEPRTDYESDAQGQSDSDENRDADDSSSPSRETTGSEESESRRLDFKYYDLDLEYDPDSS